MLGREVVEGEQRLPVRGELRHGLWPLGEVAGEGVQGRLRVGAILRVPDLPQGPLGRGLHRGGQGVQDVGHLVHPVPLPPGLREHVADGPPEPQRPVPDRQQAGPGTFGWLPDTSSAKIRAPGVERGQLGRQLFDPAGADLFSEPSLLERLEVAIQRSLGLPDPRLHGSELSLPPRPAPLHDLSPPLHGVFEELSSGKRGQEALDHSILQFLGPQAVLVALPFVPGEGHLWS